MFGSRLQRCYTLNSDADGSQPAGSQPATPAAQPATPGIFAGPKTPNVMRRSCAFDDADADIEPNEDPCESQEPKVKAGEEPKVKAGGGNGASSSTANISLSQELEALMDADEAARNAAAADADEKEKNDAEMDRDDKEKKTTTTDADDKEKNDAGLDVDDTVKDAATADSDDKEKNEAATDDPPKVSL